MKAYNQIYHLHICKTGGRFYHSNILKPNINKISNNPKLIHDIGGHFGWSDLIDDSTFIVSGIRDVVRQQCSLFVDVNITMKKMVYSYEDAKEVFFSWIEKENFAKNNMSKHFLYDKNFGNWGKELPPPTQKDFDIIIKRSDRVNLYYSIEDDFSPNYLIKRLSTAINSDIEINLDTNMSPVEPHTGSEILYNSLTDQEKEFIRSLSPLDVKLYDHIKSKINSYS